MTRREQFRLLGDSRIFFEPPDTTINKPNRDFSVNHFRNLNNQDQLELITTRRFLLDTLKVDNLKEISQLFSDPHKKQRANQRLIENYCSMLGIDGSFEIKKGIVGQSLKDANSVILMMEDSQFGILRQLRGDIGLINEIAIIDNPIDLLMLTFSPKASRRIRFEAKRKLLLADLSLRIKNQIQEAEATLDPFARFLNTHVWTDAVLGQLTEVELLSYHRPQDYSATSIQILKPDEKVRVSEFTQYHRFRTRTWQNPKKTVQASYG